MEAQDDTQDASCGDGPGCPDWQRLGPAELSRTTDHGGRAVLRWRLHRYDRPADRRADDEAARAAGHRRERRRSGRHARRRACREGRSRRLHADAAPHRPGVERRALSQAALRRRYRFCSHRARHRRADDDRGEVRLSRELYRRTPRPRPRQQGSGYLRACRGWCGVAPLRPAPDAGAGHQDDLGRLQGGRTSHDRPSRRPGGHDLRPDHQHHGPYPERQDQGLRCHHQATACRHARPAEPGRGRPEGLRGDRLARPLCPRKTRPSRC